MERDGEYHVHCREGGHGVLQGAEDDGGGIARRLGKVGEEKDVLNQVGRRLGVCERRLHAGEGGAVDECVPKQFVQYVHCGWQE